MHESHDLLSISNFFIVFVFIVTQVGHLPAKNGLAGILTPLIDQGKLSLPFITPHFLLKSPIYFENKNTQVGHLPAKNGLVGILAPLIDQGRLAIEGIMPQKGKSNFTLPCHVYLFGKPEDQQYVTQRIRSGGFIIRQPGEEEPAVAAGAGGAGGRGGAAAAAGRGGRGGRGGGVPPAAQPALQLMPKRDVEDSLNRLFDDIVRETGAIRQCDPSDEVRGGQGLHLKRAAVHTVIFINSDS
jgi:hypothetical protein